MTVWLFGAGSMLGWSIWSARPCEVTGFVNSGTKLRPAGLERGIDLDEEADVRALFDREPAPALVIHCAGVCDVEVCETSPDFAQTVNVEGTRILLAHVPPSTRVVYLSSDHVFGGDAGPYDEESPVAPISEYARTRVAAEALVRARPGSLVIRSGLWIGPSVNGKIGHLDWLRDRHRRGLPMTIVSDEVRSAMWAHEAAARVWDLARSTVTGTRHVIATRAVARPALAAHLDRRFAIGAHFETQLRHTRRMPHLGNVELATRFSDAYSTPLSSPLDEDQESRLV